MRKTVQAYSNMGINGSLLPSYVSPSPPSVAPLALAELVGVLLRSSLSPENGCETVASCPAEACFLPSATLLIACPPPTAQENRYQCYW